MPENITGQVNYNDMQHFAYLIEGTTESLLAVDVLPFNSLGPQDARYAYDYLRQKNISVGAAINFSGERREINNHPIIIIVKPF